MDGLADLRMVWTPDQFGRQLRARLGRSSRVLATALDEQAVDDAARAKAAKREPPRPERAQKSKLDDVLSGRVLPTPGLLIALLRIGKVGPTEEGLWQDTLQRVQKGPGLPRVGDVEPRRLGVHRAIATDLSAPEMPEYVRRDTDQNDDGLRAMVRDAESRGRFVVLVGESSVGKTRSAYEAVKALLPSWWLFAPSLRSGSLAGFASSPVPRTVVWLDELHRHLSGELTDDLVAAMLDVQVPILILGTLSRRRYLAYTAVGDDAGSDGDIERDARRRATLALCDVIHVDAGWSSAERLRAEDVARRDSRIAQALRYAVGRFGPPQVLAAAPQLLERWELADPYSRAILRAAADLTRLGHQSPLPRVLLRDAAYAYCDDHERARAPHGWFKSAMASCTELLLGAASVLEAVPGEGMGQVTGYVVTEYVLQHAESELRCAPVPMGLWEAAAEHVVEATDAKRLGEAAADRLLLRHAVSFLKRAVDGNELFAVHKLADLLLQQDDPGGAENALATAAKGGHTSAAFQLADLRAARNDVAGAIAVLQPAADAGDGEVGDRIAELLAEAGDTTALRVRSEMGDPMASRRLAKLLMADGRVADAAAVLRSAVAAGSSWLRRELTDLLERNDDHSGVRAVLREGVAAGDSEAARRLADTLAEEGETNAAVDVLQSFARTGDTSVIDRLSRLVETRDGAAAAVALLERAVDDEGHTHLRRLLADRLADRGDVDALRRRAATDDMWSAVALVKLLAARKDVTTLRALADGEGDETSWRAAFLLVEFLAEQADVAGLRTEAEQGNTRAAFGPPPAASPTRSGSPRLPRGVEEAGCLVGRRRYAAAWCTKASTQTTSAHTSRTHASVTRRNGAAAERIDVEIVVLPDDGGKVVGDVDRHPRDSWLDAAEALGEK